MFYKDSKTYKATPDQYYRAEAPIDLTNASATIAEDYTKKKNVFRLKWVPLICAFGRGSLT